MLMQRLGHLLTGSVCFAVYGGFRDRFLKLCSQQGICLSDTFVQGERLVATVSRKQYPLVCRIAADSGMQTELLRRRGLLFLLIRYRHRWGVVAGIAAGLCLLAVLSSVVWEVQISGCERLSEDYVRSYFEQLGVRPGRLQAQIDITDCRVRALTEIGELLWVSVYLQGCTAKIEIRERGEGMHLPEQGSSNLIASYGGEIVRADVYAGESYVKIGQAVAKGDLLVGGAVGMKNGGTYFVRSQADITARTHRTLCTEIPYEQAVVRVEKERTRYGVSFFGLRIPVLHLNLREADESCLYSIDTAQKVFPVGLYREGVRRTVQTVVTLSEQQALLQACALFTLQELNGMKEKEIIRRTVQTRVQDEMVSVCGQYVCVENIAQTQELETEIEN